jgi:diaminohydroxyphosphoribosylaminopyrimidine deaminase / 5-amino-6-(5-phosphoribosylamino)uracil reductase
MLRCVQLAQLGQGSVLPNPMVGAVLVYNNKIIGEGYHQKYGAAHAEVNCVHNVKDNEKHFIKDATLYVSLEPCNHIGKTPPCTQLILKEGIKKVVIGCSDNNELVNGTGISYLRNNGVEVITNILEEECKKLNEIFFYNQTYKLPFITLKWAQSNNHCIADSKSKPIKISNDYTNRYVHQLRNNAQAIIVGSNTIIQDDPQLTNRLYGNNQPLPIIIDRQLKLTHTYKIFKSTLKIIILNEVKNTVENNITYIKGEEGEKFFINCFQQLYILGITSILVEGGTILHNLLLQKQLYNKIITITNDGLFLPNGVAAPTINKLNLYSFFSLKNDNIEIYNNTK